MSRAIVPSVTERLRYRTAHRGPGTGTGQLLVAGNRADIGDVLAKVGARS
jgi:hypothetical protein